jgi:hypothetical protein
VERWLIREKNAQRKLCGGWLYGEMRMGGDERWGKLQASFPWLENQQKESRWENSREKGEPFFFFSFFFFGGGFLIIQGSAWIIAFMHITGINFWKPPNYCEPDLPWKD